MVQPTVAVGLSARKSWGSGEENSRPGVGLRVRSAEGLTAVGSAAFLVLGNFEAGRRGPVNSLVQIVLMNVRGRASGWDCSNIPFHTIGLMYAGSPYFVSEVGVTVKIHSKDLLRVMSPQVTHTEGPIALVHTEIQPKVMVGSHVVFFIVPRLLGLILLPQSWASLCDVTEHALVLTPAVTNQILRFGMVLWDWYNSILVCFQKFSGPNSLLIAGFELKPPKLRARDLCIFWGTQCYLRVRPGTVVYREGSYETICTMAWAATTAGRAEGLGLSGMGQPAGYSAITHHFSLLFYILYQKTPSFYLQRPIDGVAGCPVFGRVGDADGKKFPEASTLALNSWKLYRTIHMISVFKWVHHGLYRYNRAVKNER
ncbi:hypothetical protein DFH06DRAFT_1137687 [Mycena polygramma]|nr:hypothetical protein DFH06DRAFT_1137687 [Mycena polygramma]